MKVFRRLRFRVECLRHRLFCAECRADLRGETDALALREETARRNYFDEPEWTPARIASVERAIAAAEAPARERPLFIRVPLFCDHLPDPEGVCTRCGQNFALRRIRP